LALEDSLAGHAEAVPKHVEIAGLLAKLVRQGLSASGPLGYAVVQELVSCITERNNSSADDD
jgi:hypothetical protein